MQEAKEEFDRWDAERRIRLTRLKLIRSFFDVPGPQTTIHWDEP